MSIAKQSPPRHIGGVFLIAAVRPHWSHVLLGPLAL
jgi:hypothetical protein